MMMNHCDVDVQFQCKFACNVMMTRQVCFYEHLCSENAHHVDCHCEASYKNTHCIDSQHDFSVDFNHNYRMMIDSQNEISADNVYGAHVTILENMMVENMTSLWTYYYSS